MMRLGMTAGYAGLSSLFAVFAAELASHLLSQ